MWFSFQRVELLNKVSTGDWIVLKSCWIRCVIGYFGAMVKNTFKTFRGFGAAAKADVKLGKCFVLLMWHGCRNISSSDSSLSFSGNNFWRCPFKMKFESQNDEVLTSLFPQFIEIRCLPDFETPETKGGWRAVRNCQNWWNIHFIQHQYTCRHLQKAIGTTGWNVSISSLPRQLSICFSKSRESR